MNNKLEICSRFSKYTGLRYCSISDNSGEEFYHKILNFEFYESINANKKLEVILDGAKGYSPSFIDEAFGNLVYDFTLDLVCKNLVIISEDIPMWKNSIENETYKLWEQRRINESEPKKTESHNEWWRFIDKNYCKNVWIKVKND